MENQAPTYDQLKSEVTFIMSRSGGPGGQNVNKVNSKVTLSFNVAHSQLLTEEQRLQLSERLQKQLTSDGSLVVTSQSSRSQLDNKEEAIRKFNALLHKAFVRKKLRKPTSPTKAAKKKRVDQKKRVSEKKKWRQRPE